MGKFINNILEKKLSDLLDQLDWEISTIDDLESSLLNRRKGLIEIEMKIKELREYFDNANKN